MRRPIALPAALLAALLLLAVACSKTVVIVVTPSQTPTGSAVVSPPPGTLFVQARGTRFAYPSAWHVLAGGPATGGANLDLAVSPDDDSFIRLQRFALLLNVTEERLPDVKPQLAKTLRTTAELLHGQIARPLSRMDTAGLPGYVATLRLTSAKGNPAEELLYVFFDQTNEYTLACSYTDATRDEVTAACELARQTFAAPHPLPPP